VSLGVRPSVHAKLLLLVAAAALDGSGGGCGGGLDQVASLIALRSSVVDDQRIQLRCRGGSRCSRFIEKVSTVHVMQPQWICRRVCVVLCGAQA